MSEYIEYNGEDLGRLHLGKKNSKGKYTLVLVMNNVGALETLLKLSPEDELSVDGNLEKYEKFRKEILEKTQVIYTSPDEYVRAEFPFPFGERIPEDILKEAELKP